MVFSAKSFCTKYGCIVGGWGRGWIVEWILLAWFHPPSYFSPDDNSSIIYDPLAAILSPVNTIRKRGAALWPSAAAIIIVTLQLQSNVLFLFVTNYIYLCYMTISLQSCSMQKKKRSENRPEWISLSFPCFVLFSQIHAPLTSLSFRVTSGGRRFWSWNRDWDHFLCTLHVILSCSLLPLCSTLRLTNCCLFCHKEQIWIIPGLKSQVRLLFPFRP